MPLAIVSWRPFRADEKLEKLNRVLPELIANALSCSDKNGRLTAEDIEIWVRRPEPEDAGKTKNDVEVVIFTNDFPSRRRNLGKRQQAITKGLKQLLPKNFHGFVWVLLCPSSFGEF